MHVFVIERGWLTQPVDVFRVCNFCRYQAAPLVSLCPNLGLLASLSDKLGFLTHLYAFVPSYPITF